MWPSGRQRQGGNCFAAFDAFFAGAYVFGFAWSRFARFFRRLGVFFSGFGFRAFRFRFFFPLAGRFSRGRDDHLCGVEIMSEASHPIRRAWGRKDLNTDHIFGRDFNEREADELFGFAIQWHFGYVEFNGFGVFGVVASLFPARPCKRDVGAEAGQASAARCAFVSFRAGAYRCVWNPSTVRRWRISFAEKTAFVVDPVFAACPFDPAGDMATRPIGARLGQCDFSTRRRGRTG